MQHHGAARNHRTGNKEDDEQPGEHSFPKQFPKRLLDQQTVTVDAPMFGQSKDASDQKHAETENRFANQKSGRRKFVWIDGEETSENLPERLFDKEGAEFDCERKKKETPAGA